ncbi:hypothetical protein FRB91_010128 [Serendipita sp. 411]|nr:hypothetical protein FRC18_012388 [Serendipita sp. 400]KAG8849245.1 hypothetical protein FRB91_010128 [Serendipita sp. 411]
MSRNDACALIVVDYGQKMDLGLLAKNLHSDMVDAMNVLNTVDPSCVVTSDLSNGPTVQQFRVMIRTEWRLMADILQDSRVFGDNVEMLRKYFETASFREVHSVFEQMKELGEALLRDIENSKDRFSKLTTITYDDRQWNHPDHPNKRRGILKEKITFNDAALRILNRLSAMQEFWKAQLAIIRRTLNIDHPNQMSLRIEEALELAHDWEGYGRAIAAAVDGIHYTSDMVLVETHKGSILVTETGDESHLKMLFWRLWGLSAPYICYLRAWVTSSSLRNVTSDKNSRRPLEYRRM